MTRLSKFVERCRFLLNESLRHNIRQLESSMLALQLIPETRKCIDFAVKRKYLKFVIKRLRRVPHTSFDGVVHIGSFYSSEQQLQAEEHRPYDDSDDFDNDFPLPIEVSREAMLADSFSQLRNITPRQLLKGKFDVSFAEEDGVDAGGLTREWLTVLTREIFKPSFALFSPSSDGVTFQPNAHSSANPSHL